MWAGGVAGRGMVVVVADDELTVAVPVILPARGDGPSLWETCGHRLGQVQE